MRKFKYLFSKRIENRLLKKRIDLLEPEAKKRYKSNRLFFGTFSVLFYSLIFIFLVLMSVLDLLIQPVIGKTLYIILTIFCAIVLPLLILGYPFKKLEKKYPRQSLENIPRDIIAKSNHSLLKYYKVPDLYLITKCYDSSNITLINKDLILFFYKGKLRIVNDFTTTIKDFGCYEFQVDEIEVVYEQKYNLMTTEIKSRKLTLTLGKRAKPYISSRGADANEQV